MDGGRRQGGGARGAPVLRPSRRVAGAPPAIEGGCTVAEGLRQLVQVLPRVMRGLRRATPQATSNDGLRLSSRHGSALSLLRETSLSVGELAGACDLNLATTSGIIADLERVGFVARTADPSNRRRTIVAIAPGSETLVDAWLEGTSAPLVRALESLSSEERAVLVKALGNLAHELNRSVTA
jgi:DNA-binding MarR family transcriptional regulator